MFKHRAGLISILFVLVVLITPSPAVTAQDIRWRVESPVSLREALANSRIQETPHLVYIAPDGRQVAYGAKDSVTEDELLCVFDIPDQQERCVTFAHEWGYSLKLHDIFPPMRWSPDSHRIALVGFPLIYFRDTDLGLANFTEAKPAVTILSDDGFMGGFSPGQPMPEVSIESNPAFSPDGTQIAVERTPGGDENWLGSSFLSVFDTDSGQMRDLTRLPGKEVYEVDAGSVLSIDWSQSGDKLAICVRHTSMEPDYDGIWLVDVESGDMRRLISMADAENAVKATYPEPAEFFAAIHARWSPDGLRILFWAGSPGAFVQRTWLFWIDVESGEISPAPLPAHPSDQPNFRAIWPMQAAWSPDGSLLLVAARMEVPPDEPVPLIETDEPLATALYLIDPAAGEITVLGHLPVEIAPPYTAAWGPDGNVIAGGYAFKLVQE